MTDDRRDGLGASDVPAIAGASPWVTPVGLWLDRMGLSGPQPETEAMAAGKRLEGPILQLAARATGLTIHRNRVRFRHPDWPKVPLWATPDGLTRPRTTLVEVKMVGHRFADWADGPPAYVGLQVQAQLACLPRVQQAVVGALIGGELRTYRVDREPLVQQFLPALVAEWWARHILAERSPDPSGPGDQWALMRAAAATDGRDERVATTDESGWADGLLKLQEMEDDLAAQKETLRLALADAAVQSNVRGDGWTARWQLRRTVDWSAVADAYSIPSDVIERHTRVAPVFTFRRSSPKPGLSARPTAQVVPYDPIDHADREGLPRPVAKEPA